MNKTCKILGLLLCYPKEALIKSLDELYEVLVGENLLSDECLISIKKLIQYLQRNDIVKLEEDYVTLFDFRRLLSLHLFEHVHGDSRDRGQAMVDLIERYHEVGLQLKKGELPDYLPVYLEYLSVLKDGESQTALGNIINILAVLNRRLQEHDSLYYVVFSALESLSHTKPNMKIIDQTLNGYKQKAKGYAELDKEWREPAAFSRDEQPMYFTRKSELQNEGGL